MERNQTAVEQRIGQLKVRFLTTLPVRLLSIASSLSRVQDNAPGALRDLENQLHALAGTAGTYRIPAVAALAAEAEAICAAAAGALDERAIDLLRDTVAAMETLTFTDLPEAG